MSSRCLETAGRIAAALALLAMLPLAQADDDAAAASAAVPLRVCADPDNLPASRADGSGFENRIAEVIADELKRPLQTYWLPNIRGFVRKTLGAHACDLIIGVPAGFDRVLRTRPYYRSSYVLVTRAADARPLRGFDDPRLATLKVGVQLVGNDLAATPPGHALAERGATERVVGFTAMGDGPAAERMVRALAAGELDAALIWGPQAGWFAAHAPVPMNVALAHAPPGFAMPFEFSMAMGVRRGDKALRDALDAAIAHRRDEIDAILDEYRVPRVALPAGAGTQQGGPR